MNLKTLNADQRNALLDLLILGMYADGHLASVENEHIDKTLRGMGFEDKSDRDREFDASVTRVRKHSDNPQAVAAHAKTLAGKFQSRGDRQVALNFLENVLKSDNKVASGETKFLETARQAFA